MEGKYLSENNTYLSTRPKTNASFEILLLNCELHFI